jgi:hypothetical protein
VRGCERTTSVPHRSEVAHYSDSRKLRSCQRAVYNKPTNPSRNALIGTDHLDIAPDDLVRIREIAAQRFLGAQREQPSSLLVRRALWSRGDWKVQWSGRQGCQASALLMHMVLGMECFG